MNREEHAVLDSEYNPLGARRPHRAPRRFHIHRLIPVEDIRLAPYEDEAVVVQVDVPSDGSARRHKDAPVVAPGEQVMVGVDRDGGQLGYLPL